MFSGRPCPGTLVLHLDHSAWCSQPGCPTRETGDAQAARLRHATVATCSAFFAEGCPACRDGRKRAAMLSGRG